MKLIVVHYHWRPCGVRRVVELALPHLVKALGVKEVVLASGEPIEPAWREALQRRIAPAQAVFSSEPAFLYTSEQSSSPAVISRRLAEVLDPMLPASEAQNIIVWAHNLGIGRNLLLARILARTCAARHIRLIMHHHDWWFDNRWGRWPEFRRCGFRSLRSVAQTLFPAGSNTCHVSINQADANLISHHMHARSDWWPNLTTPSKAGRESIQQARCWLQNRLGIKEEPVWIMPTRLLRRKNAAEAILLTRWLRPEAWFISTGGISSADEMAYSQALQGAAHHHQWKVKLCILEKAGSDQPGVPELLGASEVILLTSLQEGFGLPYIEAASARRPLIARAISNIVPDLQRFGFAFPQLYPEILISPALFDWEAERERQKSLFNAWRTALPKPCQKLAEPPLLLLRGSLPQPVAFSRLSLTAQLEVLKWPSADSWAQCNPLNPFLQEWRQRAQNGNLDASRWPDSADQWLSGYAYAKRFSTLLAREPAASSPEPNASAIQNDFIHRNLRASNLYPLLWSNRT